MVKARSIGTQVMMNLPLSAKVMVVLCVEYFFAINKPHNAHYCAVSIYSGICKIPSLELIWYIACSCKLKTFPPLSVLVMLVLIVCAFYIKRYSYLPVNAIPTWQRTWPSFFLKNLYLHLSWKAINFLIGFSSLLWSNQANNACMC